MLTKRIPTIIPPLTLEEALETTKIHSVAGKIDNHTALETKRPFRSPHHTISDVAHVGGELFIPVMISAYSDSDLTLISG